MSGSDLRSRAGWVLSALLAVVAGLIPALQAILGVLALAGMAAIVNWIAFGVGERACSGAVGFLWLAADNAYAGLACRIPFGLAAAIIDAVLILGVVALGVLWHRLRSGHWPRNAAFIRRRP